MIKEISRNELIAFCESAAFPLIVQKNNEKYKSRWLKWSEKKEKIKFGSTQSWNWAGFFLGEFWLLYRKMYMTAIAIIACRIATIITPLFLPQFSNVMSILPLIISLLIAILSYDWYLLKTYSLYKKCKENRSELSEIKDDFQQQGGTNLKAPIAYLIAFIVIIGLAVIGLMDSSEDNKNSSYNSNYSENIEAVRGGIFGFDESIFLANALENYPYFTSYAWEEFRTPQGRHIVRFTGEYDVLKDINDMKSANKLSQKFFVIEEKIPTVQLVFDFVFLADGTNFEIFSSEVLANQQTYFNLKFNGDNTIPILRLIYNGSIFMLNEGVSLAIILARDYSFAAENRNQGYQNTSNIAENQNQGYQNTSSTLELVKNATLAFDNSITIGNALENYSYFSSYSWKELTNEQGRNIVRFIGKYDINAEIQEMKKRGLMNAEEFLEGTSSSSLIIDFSLSQDKNTFSLYRGELQLNGQSEFAGEADFAEYLLQPVYNNVPYLGSIINQ